MGSKEVIQQQERQQELEEMRRTPLPRGTQVIGICEQRVGGSRMKVKCMDGKNRICRIPGRVKRKLWIREGDVLLVEPWELCGNEKGDVLFKYKPMQVHVLKEKGLLKTDSIDEF